ncbi:N-acetyltransferase [Peribacillus acanthi]|uniref:N-acetyltransferase n=1 Tax=Peribacillus acanthi TaxID=2171554 RepID=UPI000D3EBF4B|nr:N-acetyltransferase [Peribacillus acanthi]
MTIIYEGKLVKGQQLFQVQPLSINHLSEIMRLQQTTVDMLIDNESLQPLTIEEYQFILEGNGFMIGAFVESQLVAFRALLVPEIDQEHLGYDIGFREEDLPNIIYQEISMVHPIYRGNKLQQTLATLIMDELAKRKTRYTHICCTVSPFNIPSLKDKFAQQMKIAALKTKYGDKKRYIFVKEIAHNDQGSSFETTHLPLHDLTNQESLLANGWRGIGLKEINGEFVVLFEKMK